VTGKEPLGGDFSQPPVQVARVTNPKTGRTAPTLKWNDKGTQVQAYYAVNSYLTYLASLGFDVKALLGATHKGSSHAVRVLVNEFEDMNAYAMPGEDYIAFGTSNGKWSLGADHDVVMHECDHLLTFHAIPQLRGTEGGAIHEGGADAAAAICHRDAEMSEDFGLMLGGRPGPSVGLRTANNTLNISDVGEEPHDRGEVYSGYWWSLMERIGHDPRFDKLTPEVRSGVARDLAMRLYYNHKLAYPSFNPTPADFVDAVLRAARGLDRADNGGGKILPIPIADLEAKILAVAADRELLKAPKPPVMDDIEIEAGSSRQRGIDNARRWWRDREIHFRRFSQAPGLGFETETLQQVYWCKKVRITDGTSQGKELAVDVVGHGLNSWTANGKQFEVSHKDVREIRTDDIDERMNIPFEAAVQLSQKRLAAELQEALEEWEKVQRRQPRTRAEAKRREGTFLKYQMFKLVEALSKKPHEIPQRLVIVGEDRYLCWAVQLGPLTFYIPALSNYLKKKDAIRLDSNIFYCSHDHRAPTTATA
ncbi:MAG: hypothetical protein HYW02_05710, partial [Deltaproteobacteria bacterium]|nr:hypothetical protein [Deltaproteobacteria bacterium]